MPGLLKLTLLFGLRRFVDARPQMRAESFKTLKGATTAVMLVNVVRGLVLALWAGIWVHGTAVLSSTIVLSLNIMQLCIYCLSIKSML